MSPLIAVIAILVAAVLLWLLLRDRGQGALLIKQEIDQLRQSHDGNIRQVYDQLGKLTGEIGKRLEERLDNAARVVGEVQSRLGRLEVATQQVHSIGRDIAVLQESLRAPKFRGGFGEFTLENLLSQILPAEFFSVQYRFRNGEIVDAVVKTRDGLIAIDAKFPFANFRRLVEAKGEEEKRAIRKEFVRDVKRHVEDVTKYIRPDEGTLPFALMYIPAENVYYEVMINGDEVDGDFLAFAQKNRVFPVSPHSFHAYLQTIWIGLRGMRIEEWAQNLDASLQRLKEDLHRFMEEFGQVGNHLKNMRQKYESAEKRLENFQEKFQGLETPSSSEPERLKIIPGAQ